jgi:hypothetical protein
MYHDTIHIRFKYYNHKDINFDYSFFISKYENNSNYKTNNLFSPIKYGELLHKFYSIGFNLKYLRFNDISEDDTVYCSYNYQPNFNKFFLLYSKLIEQKNFEISLEYGNIIHGNFIPNNMNFFAGVHFIPHKKEVQTEFSESVVGGKLHKKYTELYQIIDKNGLVIANEVTSGILNFEQHFFEKHEVKVALRKYKLSRLDSL